jgi:hypothetical protein
MPVPVGSGTRRVPGTRTRIAIPNAKELGAQGASAREKGSEQKTKSRTSARCTVLKGTGVTLHLRRRARRVSTTFARSRAHPSETAACNRDASIPAT